MKVLYLAGPLTPKKTGTTMEYLWNCRNFFLAEAFLFRAGYCVFNPACDIVSLLFFQPMPEIEQVYQLSLEWVRRCDGVVLLPGWENSQGVKLELQEAMRRKLELYTLSFSPDGFPEKLTEFSERKVKI